MRITNKTIYDSMELRLRNLTRALSESNLVVTTGKQINRLSDNPTGVSQVLAIKANINNITQYDKNMDAGLNWLTGGESALSSVNDLILDMQLLSNQLINASNSEAQRADAIERVNGVLDQILAIGNTEINNSYIFSGSKITTKPLVFDRAVDPRKVIYQGDHQAFAVKTEKTATLEVGRDGSAVFWEDSIRVDHTNNRITFREDVGLGPNSERTLTGMIPDGTYTAEGLALAVRNAMNAASEAYGHGIVYDVVADEETGKFQITPDGSSYDGELTFTLLLDPTREPLVGNINTGIGAEIDIAGILADAGSGADPGDLVEFTLSAGGETAAVAFTVDADNDTTRANFLTALTSALAGMDGVDLAIDADRLTAAENSVTITSLSGLRIHADNLTLTNNAAGSFGGNYAANGFDYNGGTTTGDVIRFDLTLGDVTVANITVDMDAIGDAGPVTNATIADAISRHFNNGVALNNGEHVVLGDGAGNQVTIGRNGNDFTFVTTGGQAFAIANFSDDNAGALGNAAGLSVTAGNGTDLGSTGGPGTVLVNSPLGETFTPRPATLDPQGFDTAGGAPLFDAGVTVLNPEALTISTPSPLGSAPFRLVWGGTGWIVQNDPGYELPVNITGTADGVDLDLDEDGAADIRVRFATPVSRADDFIAFDIIADAAAGSIGVDLGLEARDVTYRALTGDNPVTPINRIMIDHTNNHIDFEEFDIAGASSGVLTATIPPGPGPNGEYTDMDTLSAAIEAALEAASTIAPPADYTVAYDPETSRFSIHGDGASLGQVNFLWRSGPNADTSAGDTLGFFLADDVMEIPVSDHPVPLFTITNDNNRIDFEEVVAGVATPLGVTLTNGSYTSPADLALEIEARLEAATANGVDYAVDYDPVTRRFTIADAGATLNELHLLWNSGLNHARSAATVLGYDNAEHAAGTVGGDLLGNGWENGDVISMDFTIAGSTMTFTHTVDTAVDTNESILTALQGRLTAAFGTAGTFALNGAGIDFTLQNATLRIDNFTDSGGANARFDLSGISGTTLLPPPGGSITANGGAAVTFYAPDDDAAAGVSSHAADNQAVLITIDASNNRIDFAEYDLTGRTSGERTAVIPVGAYTDLTSLSMAIENALEAASGLTPPVDYSVSYDGANRRFIISGESTGMSELRLLWGTGSHRTSSAAATLGFDGTDDVVTVPGSDEYVAHITIDDSNNRIDFREIVRRGDTRETCELCAVIPNGEYRNLAELAAAVEEAMNGESAHFGHGVAYDVSYDPTNRTFTIKESGVTLDQLDLLWQSGRNSNASAAGVLGFNPEDDSVAVLESDKQTEWGIFQTLIDLKGYLEANDVSGIERSLTRLHTHYNHIESFIADTGVKANRIEVKQKINIDLNLSLTERRSNIEDADYIKALMDLQKNQLAYQAALSSSAKVMKLSLVDFL
ncbi:MAG: flagellar hook-associated protein FlgL [Thermodesulfobacteriota bacterium]